MKYSTKNWLNNYLGNSLKDSIRAAVLGSLVMTTSLAQDTWVAELTISESYSAASAVSDAGKIAVVSNNGDSSGVDVTILTASAAPFSEFQIGPGTSNWIDINDALFLDETTLVLAGSIDGNPYMGAFHIGTGQPVWEQSLTAPGIISKMTRNSIGKIIGTGTTSGSPSKGFVCAVNPTGAWSWFRYYNPGSNTTGTNNNFAAQMVPLPNGDMFLLSSGSSGLAISRLTDWGHEVWSKWITTPDLGIRTVAGCINSDGDLFVSCRYEASNFQENCVFRMTPAGSIVWAKRYDLPELNGNFPTVGSVLPGDNGGVTVGWTVEAGSSRSQSMAKIASNGQVEWARDYSAGAVGTVSKIMKLSTGGFVSVFRSGPYTASVSRMDSFGYSGPCADRLITANISDAVVNTTSFTYHYDAFPGGIGTLQVSTSTTASQVEVICSSTDNDTVGTIFCDPANPNSTGVSTILSGAITSPSGTGLHLEARRGPVGQFGYFLIGTAINPAGTVLDQGRLCLSLAAGEQFGRYNVAGTNMNSVGQFGPGGHLQNMVGTSSVGSGFDVPLEIPGIGGSIFSGQTWNFQLWHRELGGHSNLSNGISVNF